jgi:hypothetical protein
MVDFPCCLQFNSVHHEYELQNQITQQKSGVQSIMLTVDHKKEAVRTTFQEGTFP